MFFIIAVNVYGQDDGDYPPAGECPEGVEYYPPGEDEPGCIDYTDCNENGAFDIGEPCHDGPPSGEEGGEEYGEHTVENCIALEEGRDSYWIGEEEFVVWDDSNVDCGFLLEEIGYEPPPTDDGEDNDHDWYCAICDMHFATEAEMDQHAADMGHTHTHEVGCDPEADYPENPPGEGEGCMSYEDCNGNGVFDIGEPCHDGHPEGD